VLSKSLALAEGLVAGGERDAATIAEKMRAVILTAEDARIDYVALVDPDTLEPVARIDGPAMALLAVHVETTRLIDNRLLDPSIFSPASGP
jgi:pantoate--beta-alanine ligase